MIWKNRKLTYHNKKGLDIFLISAFVKNKASFSSNPAFKFSVLDGDLSLTWQPPNGRNLKFNCDGSWLKSSNRAGMGFVLRDFNGTILGSVAFVVEKVPNRVAPEGLALLYAMRWANKLNIIECSFETDCIKVFNLIQGHSGWSPYAEPWTAECATLLYRNETWVLSVIRKEANRVADALAKKADIQRCSWSSTDVVPIFLRDVD